eukprot:3910374-Rhodomonas_salina.1
MEKGKVVKNCARAGELPARVCLLPPSLPPSLPSCPSSIPLLSALLLCPSPPQSLHAPLLSSVPLPLQGDAASWVGSVPCASHTPIMRL